MGHADRVSSQSAQIRRKTKIDAVQKLDDCEVFEQLCEISAAGPTSNRVDGANRAS
jgi:hypothetical protein